MKIVIVGCGKVGETLSHHLASEGHDIVVIDVNERVAGIIDSMDINIIIGNGAIIDVQKEAGVPHADLLLAVTGMDEVNMLVCMIAKKLGAKHTIARVRNPEYSQQMHLLKEELGLSLSINPELAAASEISRLLRFPSAMTVDLFAKGRVELADYRIKADSPLDNLPVHQLHRKFPHRVLICSVERDGKVLIPKGDTVLQANDKINLAAQPKDMELFFRETGALAKHTIRSVMIVGGGRIAYYLGNQLTDMGMHVKIIESNKAQCYALSDALPRATIINGDGTDHRLLLEEGIENCDALITLTGIDEENIIISMYAKQKLRGALKKIITKVNRTMLLDMLENSDVETFISPKMITAMQILQYVRAMSNSLGSNVETLHTIANGRVEAAEFRIKAGAKCVGIPLMNLKLKDNLLIACIIRKGRVIIPGGNDTIEAGDSVIVVSSEIKLYDIDDILL